MMAKFVMKLGMYRLYTRIIAFHKLVLINANCEEIITR